jgi:hypothetical protein
MTNSTYNAHTNPLFKKHKILTYDLLIKQAQLTFMHAIEHNLSPSSFANTWIKNANREPLLNLRNANDFCLAHLKNLRAMLSLQYGILLRHTLNTNPTN